MSYKPSKEQLQFLEAREKEIYLIGKPGTGKTTTLGIFCKKHYTKNILYIVYNKENRAHAKKRFANNVEVHTSHSLAHSELGCLYKNKLSQNLEIKRIYHFILSSSEINNIDNNIYKKAYAVREALQNFFSMKGDKIFHPDAEIASIAQVYWFEMQNINNINIPMTQDGYLKLWQLSKPLLNYDYILIDEAQDSNEVLISVLDEQKTNKIFVGDPFQSIYGYRNTYNVFKRAISKNMYYLSYSYRFGKEIADIINLFMNKLYKDKYKYIAGNENINSVVQEVDKTKSYTYIARTNAEIIKKAYLLSEQHIKIKIVGGLNKKDVEDFLHLYNGDLYKIKSKWIKNYKSFSKVKEIAEEVGDVELKGYVKLIEEYEDKLFDMIKMIEFNLYDKNAIVTLITAHKSKGLEFDNVVLANDFIDFFNKNGEIKQRIDIDNEEIHLLYVAMSRAMQTLEINKKTLKFIYL